MSKPLYRHQTYNIFSAIKGSGTLASLTHRVVTSYDIYKNLQELLPYNVWINSQPGPTEGQSFTLLVKNPSTAILLRQYSQEIEKFLLNTGTGFVRLKIKIFDQ